MLLRSLYALAIVALLGGTAWTAADASSGRVKPHAGIGLVILAALQR